MKIVSVMEKISRWLFPPFCVGCSGLLPISTRIPLCEKCLEKYKEDAEIICPDCHRKMRECTCPALFFPGENIAHLYKVMPYRPDLGVNDPVNRMVFSMKAHPYRDVFGFVSEELLSVVREQGILREPCVVCYVPSSDNRIRKSGFDHSRELAETFARRCHVPVSRILIHSSKGKAVQKGLSRQERKNNAHMNYLLRPGISLTGTYVILIDDICTTGATLSSCTRLLRSAGAKRVFCVVFAKTVS